MQLRIVAALVVVFAAAASARVLHTRTAPPMGWAVREAAPADQEVTFMVALKQQNVDKLEETLYAVSDPKSPRYRKFLSVDEIQAIVRPTVETRTAVLAWLSEYVSISNVEDVSDMYRVTTTIKTAAEALGTSFVRYEHLRTRKSIVRVRGAYSVPKHLDEHIELVAGISEFPDLERVRKVGGADGFTGVVPQTLAGFYNPTGLPTAQNTSVGVIEWEGQYFSTSDLAEFAKQTAQTIPPLSADHIVGQNQPSDPGDEADLDIQWALATGSGATGWFWINGGSAWLYGFITAFLQADSVPAVVSMSYGWAEDDQCADGIGGAECQQLGLNATAYVKRVNTEFMKAGTAGVSLLASSGDSGANGRTDPSCSDTHLNPTFPAASPYVTAVGATQVNTPSTSLQNAPPVCSSGQVTCISGGTEVAVSYQHANFASGGGFSNIASTPSYQSTAVQNYLSGSTKLPPSSYYNSQGRGYPDVAAFGSDIVIVDDGSVSSVGGTSCSSPMFAGYVSLLNVVSQQSSGANLGFLNPMLYQAPANAFNDITVGDNKCTESGCGFGGSCKGYECAAGWDPVTGLGSPNVANLVSYVQSL